MCYITARPEFHTALFYSLSSCSLTLHARCRDLWSGTQRYGEQIGGDGMLSWKARQRRLEGSVLDQLVSLLSHPTI